MYLGLAGTLSTQGPEGVYGASGGIGRLLGDIGAICEASGVLGVY